MSDPPLVTVLLTSYNRAHWLQQAIESVLGQSMPDLELIILDDNSPRGSGVAQVLNSIRDPRAWVIQSRITEDERPRSARYAVLINQGLRLACGTYVSYLCDDDWYFADRLHWMLAAFEEQPLADVVYGSQVIVDGDRDDATIGERPAGRVLFEPAYLVDHCSVMHKRCLVDEVGWWDEAPDGQAAGDAKYWTRLAAAGHPFYPTRSPRPLDAHRLHAGSLTGRMDPEQLEADRLAGRIV